MSTAVLRALTARSAFRGTPQLRRMHAMSLSRRHPRRLRIESLESRRVLASNFVTTPNDIVDSNDADQSTVAANRLLSDATGTGVRLSAADSLTLDAGMGADRGDAPDSYGTLIASNGAAHHASNLTLGALIDQDADGQPTAAADGDGDDDDGVIFATPIVTGLTANTASIVVERV